MNYYQHHIGDYITKTQGLTDEQSMTYLKLIWEYMTTEKRLPLNIDILVAKTGRKRELIESILSIYFEKTDDGFFNARCEEEIQKYTSISEVRRKVALQQHKSKHAKAVQKHSKSSAIECKPITNNQEPITNKKENIKEKVLTSKNSLTPCSESELIELSLRRKVILAEVRRTQEILLNHIADGNPKKYKNLFRTLDNWLLMGLQRGTLREAPTSMLPQTPMPTQARPLTPAEEENIRIMEAGIVKSEPTVDITGLMSDFKSSYKTL